MVLPPYFSPATFLLQGYYRRPYKIDILDIIIVRSNPSLSAIARRFFERGASFFCCKALKNKRDKSYIKSFIIILISYNCKWSGVLFPQVSFYLRVLGFHTRYACIPHREYDGLPWT